MSIELEYDVKLEEYCIHQHWASPPEDYVWLNLIDLKELYVLINKELARLECQRT